MKILQNGQIPYTLRFSDLLEKDKVVEEIESAQEALAAALKRATTACDDEWADLIVAGAIPDVDWRNDQWAEFLGFSDDGKIVNYHLIDAETEDE